MQSAERHVVLIGTGGTIAGAAQAARDHLDYEAGALSVGELVAAVPALQEVPLEAENLAQLDSRDMDHATWQSLARRAAHHLARTEVAGVVVTHGTDTLEETAYFLHRTVEADKPLVLTAAMRPATALCADGPQNLLDAVTLAREPGARGVLIAFGGRVFGAADLRKVHGYRLEAFDAGDAGALASFEDGRLRLYRAWPSQEVHRADALAVDVALWPVVDIVCSHAGARGSVIDALAAAGAGGIVIAGTGNGSVHASLLAAADRAQALGLRVRRSSRCILGGVVGNLPGALPSAGPLTPVQARIELLLDLLAELGA